MTPEQLMPLAAVGFVAIAFLCIAGVMKLIHSLIGHDSDAWPLIGLVVTIIMAVLSFIFD
jgi:hypothetical protein